MATTPLTNDQLRQFLADTNATEGNLSDSDLQKRIDAFQKLSGQADKISTDFRGQVEKVLSERIGTPYWNIHPENKKADIQSVYSHILGGGDGTNFDGSSYLKSGGTNSVVADLARQYQAALATTPTYANEIANAQGIQKDRQYVTDANAQVDALQGQIPDLLAKNRDQFYSQQRKFAQDYITGEYAPQVVQQLNARGLANSGEVGAAIADKSNSLNSTIEQAQLDQTNNELNFWANQAYQNTFDKLIAARTDVSGQVQATRKDALTKSSQDFTKANADIQSQYNLKLFKQQNEQALSAYRTQVDKAKSTAQSQSEANAIGEIAQTAVGIAGLAALG